MSRKTRKRMKRTYMCAVVDEPEEEGGKWI
jgi:hypothetical protein